MLRLVAISIGTVVALGVAPCGDEASAQAGAKDACEAIGMQGIRPPAPRVEIDRAVATNIVVHLKRTCNLIAKLTGENPNPKVTRPLNLIGARLNALVLAPIYREHPDLRRLTAAEPLPPTPKPQAGARPVAAMGPVTATYLRWALSNIQRSAADVPMNLCHGAEGSCFRPVLDLIAEIGFAESPVYASFPNLFVLDMKETWRRRPGRTAKTDASFRKTSPKPGSVIVTPAALKVVRDYLTTLNKKIGPLCEVASFSWTLGRRSKGPDDKDWTVSGPGVTLGSFQCREIPPDVVQRIDGLRIAFFGDKPDRFAGKTIDRENGRFVLKDRGVVPGR